MRPWRCGAVPRSWRGVHGGAGRRGAWLGRAGGWPCRPAQPGPGAGRAPASATVRERREVQGRTWPGLIRRLRDIRRGGSAAIDLCAVAAGRVDGYFERGHAPVGPRRGRAGRERGGSRRGGLPRGSRLGGDGRGGRPGCFRTLHGRWTPWERRARTTRAVLRGSPGCRWTAAAQAATARHQRIDAVFGGEAVQRRARPARLGRKTSLELRRRGAGAASVSSILWRRRAVKSSMHDSLAVLGRPRAGSPGRRTAGGSEPGSSVRREGVSGAPPVRDG